MGAPRQYSGTVVKVIDADTVAMILDLGFHVDIRLSCRLYGINAIELSKPGGKEARAHLAALLPEGAVVPVTSIAVDRYSGRFVGSIQLPDGRDAAAMLVEAGFAAVWNGKGPRLTPPWPRPEPAK